MTEFEWLECTDLSTLLGQVKGPQSRRNVSGNGSERKLRLFACACCRRIWHLLPDPRSREAVLTGERFADGKASVLERDGALRAAGNASTDFSDMHWNGDWASLEVPVIAAATAAEMTVVEGDTQFDEHTPYLPDAEEATLNCVRAVAFDGGPAAGQAEAAAQRSIFHDLIGNPFRPLPDVRTCLTDGVVQLARSIYIERRFDRLPELADILEQAGCTNADVLSHCRGSGPHVRGCWVIDLILGKK